MGATSDVTITHIGGPTVLIELEGWTILTDPTFDAPGRRYEFGLGTSSVKTGAPALRPADLPAIDAVLLSHDHHADNLDYTGRELLEAIPRVLTTRSGARRLRLDHVRGLRPWEQTTLRKPGSEPLRITATPSRHGPPLSRLLVGDTVGFAIHRPDEDHAAVWMSGDSVMFPGLEEVARRLEVDIALLHLGAVRFDITGPVKYTMNARQAACLIELLRPRVALPVHYEGWSHFTETFEHAQLQFLGEAAEIRHRVRWLPHGQPVTFESVPPTSRKE